MFAGVFLAFTGVWGVVLGRTGVLEGGQPAQAVILSIQMGGRKLTYQGVDERWLAVLELKVQPSDGPAFEAKAEHYVPVLEIPRFQPGAVVDVRYDPQDKTKVAVV